MFDDLKATRYFEFNLPLLSDGEYDDYLEVNVVTLEEKDINNKFDTNYSNYLQGGCYYDGKIYSLKRFSDNVTNCPRLSVVDLEKGEEVSVINLMDIGISNEPELVFIDKGILYYATNNGKFYKFTFI